MHHVHGLPVTIISAAACMSLAGERVGAEEAKTVAIAFAAESQSDNQWDLEIGDLTQILTPEQLEQALGRELHRLSGVETPADEQLEQIEVRAVREQHGQVAANIPFGFASLAWAFQNPAAAWRIFFPVELEG